MPADTMCFGLCICPDPFVRCIYPALDMMKFKRQLRDEILVDSDFWVTGIFQFLRFL